MVLANIWFFLINNLIFYLIHAKVEVAAGKVDPDRPGRARRVRHCLKLKHGAL